jgi:hypothetical protein
VPRELGREPQYEGFADEFGDHAEQSFFNAFIDRPACLELLGDVDGRNVLDAACGPGIYADDRIGARRELRRVLAPGGAVVLSRLHPTTDWLRHGGDYFATRVVEETWDRGWQVRFWIAPLEQTCAEVAEAGFLIERLVEPRPIPEARERDAERYERYARAPAFVALRLVAC